MINIPQSYLYLVSFWDTDRKSVPFCILSHELRQHYHNFVDVNLYYMMGSIKPKPYRAEIEESRDRKEKRTIGIYPDERLRCMLHRLFIIRDNYITDLDD